MWPTVWTIGHSTRPLDEFLGLLDAHDIELIIDVRRFPGSRRLPHFGQAALAAALEARTVAYCWLPALGGRRRPDPASPHLGWRHPAFRAYADHVASDVFAEGLFELLMLAQGLRAAMMCGEALWWRCHRRIIADVLVSLGVPVMHIQGAGEAEHHRLRAPARLVDGRLDYAPESGAVDESPAAEPPAASRQSRRTSGASGAHHYRPGATIVLAPHDPGWATAFAREASAITNALAGLSVELHHIGSTAISDIVAKPVIDMLAIVPSVDALDARAHLLTALGYEALGEFGIPGRRYFRKNALDGARTHQLHAFAAGSPHIERHLDFRDFLRAFPAEAAAYETLKKELAARCGSDMAAYSDGKTEFIRRVERRAAAWRERTAPKR